MFKNERIEVSPVMNGYLVEYSYRKRNDNAEDKYDRVTYVDEKYVYTNWDDVVKFVNDKKFDVPPATI